MSDAPLYVGAKSKHKGPQRDWYFIAEQPAPAPHIAHPEGCAALRILLVTVPRVSRSCEHFPDGFDLHLLRLSSSLKNIKDLTDVGPSGQARRRGGRLAQLLRLGLRPPSNNLLVRVHFIVVMIRWTGLAPWEFEFRFPGSLTSTFLGFTTRWKAGPTPSGRSTPSDTGVQGYLAHKKHPRPPRTAI